MYGPRQIKGGIATLAFGALAAFSSVSAAAADLRLVDAAMKQDTARVRTLLKSGGRRIDVNTPQGDGATALHWAVHWDDEEMAGLLLGARANVNAANELGVTPLWLACVNANQAMVKRLLAAGANANVTLPSGETALMTAARTGSAEVVTILLAGGADVNAREHTQGQTALMWAVAERHSAIVKALLAAGANLTLRSKVRPRWINTEVGGFNGKTAREIEKGGFTAMLFAAQQGDLETVRLLAAAGADANDTAPDGTTALVVAAHSGHEPVALFLLERGASPNAAGAGYSALHAAVLRGKAALVKALLAKGADVNAILAKATPIRRNSADYALEADVVGATPLWLASKFLEPDIMRVLAAAGANPSANPESGVTALQAAVQSRKRTEPGLTPDPSRDEQLAFDAATLLLELGADVNAAGKDGTTALHIAATRRLNRIVQLLVDRGAEVNAKNEKGLTPLAIASAGGRPANRPEGSISTADLLRKLGAVE